MEKGFRQAVYIGLGANLAHPRLGKPVSTLRAALDRLTGPHIGVLRVSPRYRTAPVPVSDQPWYVNAVAELKTDFSADTLLAHLHEVEAELGRERSVIDAARVIDLDLLDFNGEIALGGPGRAILPHPRMALREFVLRPLADLAPQWRYPGTGVLVSALLANLRLQQQGAERLPPSDDLPFGSRRV